MLAQVVYIAANVYALGLVVYCACGWIKHRASDRARGWLQKWYEPLLTLIRRAVRPVRLGKAQVDLAPVVLLLATMLARGLAVSLLKVRY